MSNIYLANELNRIFRELPEYKAKFLRASSFGLMQDSSQALFEHYITGFSLKIHTNADGTNADTQSCKNEVILRKTKPRTFRLLSSSRSSNNFCLLV